MLCCFEWFQNACLRQTLKTENAGITNPSARDFIRSKATQEDLLELIDMIDEKLSEMKEV